MRQQISRDEAEGYLQMGEDDLYEMLVPEHLKEQLFSREGVVDQGKQLFVNALRSSRSAICRQYAASKDSVRDSVELMGVVLAAIPALHCPLLPVAALVVKIGIDQICKGWTDEQQSP